MKGVMTFEELNPYEYIRLFQNNKEVYRGHVCNMPNEYKDKTFFYGLNSLCGRIITILEEK